ncbi:MAG: sigma-70 family RNA polymerase sigma factor [Propionibacteriaceae bacterium]|jgi:RNA polymerase sigma-70 factor (ECF subfamily)|nr:sigma-70 family RNA polymerase sigma factor [Propionibacteriaceae bacterium]
MSDTTEIVERYQQMVYAICLTHTGCRGDAEDAFQEVFLTYHRKQPVCHDEEHRKAWLIRTTLMVARRLATSSWRTRVGPLPEVAAPEAYRVGIEEFDDLFRALTALPDDYRTVIHLFYFEDLPIAQIAALLGQAPGAVKTRLSRGRTMLRAALVKEDCRV